MQPNPSSDTSRVPSLRVFIFKSLEFKTRPGCSDSGSLIDWNHCLFGRGKLKSLCLGLRYALLLRCRGNGMKAKKSEQSEGPQIAQVLHELAKAISKAMGHASEVSTAVPGLTLYQNTVP